MFSLAHSAHTAFLALACVLLAALPQPVHASSSLPLSLAEEEVRALWASRHLPENVDRALLHLEQVTSDSPHDYEAHWRFAAFSYWKAKHGPTAPDADIQLLASLSRQHATIHRDDGGYLLEAHGPTRVNQRRVVEWTELPDGADITLGHTVRLAFHRPTVLSGSGRLSFQSDHRPTHSLDGVVLVADTCLLGPGRDCHVRCPEWEDSVILIHRSGQWLVRSPRLALEINGKSLRGEARIGDGQIVTGPDLRFHIETLSARSSNRGGRR